MVKTKITFRLFLIVPFSTWSIGKPVVIDVQTYFCVLHQGPQPKEAIRHKPKHPKVCFHHTILNVVEARWKL